MQSFLRRFGFLAFAFLIVSPAAAQVAVELTPSYGLTLPTGQLCCAGETLTLSGGELRLTSQELEAAPAIGIALGVRRGALGFEAALAFTPTKQTDDIGFRFQGVDIPVSNAEQSVVLFSGSLLWYPGSNPIFEPYLALGAGGRTLSKGDVFGGWEDNTVDVTIGIGGGLRFHYNDRFSIRIDARDWISTFDWNESSADNDLENMNLIILSTGLSIVLGGN